MARFFERRDNQYVSNYVPLPLGLMQGAVEREQKKLDTNRAAIAEIKSYTAEAKTFYEHSGEVTDDYKYIQEQQQYITNRVGELAKKLEDPNTTDMAAISREIASINKEKFVQENQGGAMYQIAKNKKLWEDEAKKIKESGQLDDVVQSKLKELDLKYQYQGSYRGLDYKGDTLPKFTSVPDELRKTIKSVKPEEVRERGWTQLSYIPGYNRDITTSREQVTYNELVGAGISYLNEQSNVKENLDAQWRAKANDKGLEIWNKTMKETGDKDKAIKAYEQEYKSVYNYEQGVLDPSNWKQDEKTGVIEYNVDKESASKYGVPVAYDMITNAAEESDYLKDKNIWRADAMPGYWGAGSQTSDSNVIVSKKEDYIDTKEWTYDEYKKNIEGNIGTIREMQANVDKITDPIEKRKAIQTLNNLVLQTSKYQNVVAPVEQELYNKAQTNANDLASKIFNSGDKTLLKDIANQAGLAGEMTKEDLSNIIRERLQSGTPLLQATSTTSAENYSTEGMKRLKETIKASEDYGKLKRKATESRYDFTTKPTFYSAVKQTGNFANYLKVADETYANAAQIEAEKKDTKLKEIKKGDKTTKAPPMIRVPDIFEGVPEIAYETEDGGYVSVPINDMADLDYGIVIDGLEETAKSEPIRKAGKQQEVYDEISNLSLMRDIGTELNEANPVNLKVGQVVDLYSKQHGRFVRLEKTADNGLGGNFKVSIEDNGAFKKIGDGEGLGGASKELLKLYKYKPDAGK